MIRDATESVAASRSIPAEEVISGDPIDDEGAQSLLAQGKSMGVFYVESPAMRLLQQKAARGDFEHLVIHSSIIRPAANDYINEYLARLRGKAWEPLHPLLAGVLDESLGIPVYQEDVCKILIALAGYDHTEADRFRKCLGKRDARARLEARKGEFFARAKAREVDRATLDRVWDMFLSMTGYSFCKPHSASYAQVSFEAAYLRAHYPAHFMAAVITNGGGYYSTQAYVSEAMRMGVRVRAPDVNRSEINYTAEHDALRVGLQAIHGLCAKTMALILACRERDGRFQDLADFCTRAAVDPSDLQHLAVVGALDTLAPGLNRPQILWLATHMRQHVVRGDHLFALPTSRVPELPPFTPAQRREHEYAGLGFLINDHPLSLYADRLARVKDQVTSSQHISERAGRSISLLAWPITAKVVSTKRSEPMEFVSFEDFDGIYETVLFPRAYRRYARMLTKARPFVIQGRVLTEWGVPTIMVERVRAA